MNARIGRWRLRVVAALAGLIVGCASLPTTRYYRLEGPPAIAAAEAATARLGVRPFRVAAPFDQDRLVYRDAGSPEVGFYAYHRWAAPLSRMLQQVAVDVLNQQSALRGRVDLAGSASDYAAWLEARVLEFGEVDRVDGHGVAFRIELRLTDQQGAPSWSTVLAGERATASTEVADLVQALNDIWVEALAQMAPTLAERLP